MPRIPELRLACRSNSECPLSTTAFAWVRLAAPRSATCRASCRNVRGARFASRAALRGVPARAPTKQCGPAGCAAAGCAINAGEQVVPHTRRALRACEPPLPPLSPLSAGHRRERHARTLIAPLPPPCATDIPERAIVAPGLPASSHLSPPPALCDFPRERARRRGWERAGVPVLPHCAARTRLGRRGSGSPRCAQDAVRGN